MSSEALARVHRVIVREALNMRGLIEDKQFSRLRCESISLLCWLATIFVCSWTVRSEIENHTRLSLDYLQNLEAVRLPESSLSHALTKTHDERPFHSVELSTCLKLNTKESGNDKKTLKMRSKTSVTQSVSPATATSIRISADHTLSTSKRSRPCSRTNTTTRPQLISLRGTDTRTGHRQ